MTFVRPGSDDALFLTCSHVVQVTTTVLRRPRNSHVLPRFVKRFTG
jgi:hypothetical protein